MNGIDLMDVFSGRNKNRPGLRKGIDLMEKGDVLIGTRMDRVSRTLRDSFKIQAMLESKKWDPVSFSAFAFDGCIATVERGCFR